MMKPRTALISVSDKTGIVELANGLIRNGISIISTGGTYSLLTEHNIRAKKISDITGFPEILDGRVKTLNPMIYGGLLADRSNIEHLKTLNRHNINPVDIVVVNLYPFADAVKKGESAVENIDIGGVSLIRAAAKNHNNVAVLTDKGQYQPILKELTESNGISQETLKVLAVEGFNHTSAYDASIHAYYSAEYGKILGSHPVDSYEDPGVRAFNKDFPKHLTPAYARERKLRYGENPHQRGALYKEIGYTGNGIINSEHLNGKKLSYNNFLDFSGALNIVREFEDPTAVLIKHNNPCGVATADTISEAYDNALACDPMSAFGGIISLNRTVDVETAKSIKSSFKEGVVAPDFEEEAVGILSRKKKRIILRVKKMEVPFEPTFTKVDGGLLLQDPNHGKLDSEQMKTVSEKKPTEKEIRSLIYAWKVIKHVRSNAIILVKDTRTVGIGAGQMSRVDSAIIASRKAGEEAINSVMASDAFIPFRDSIDVAAESGITSVIQPGGSIRDKEVLDAVNEYGISMVYTGARNFKH